MTADRIMGRAETIARQLVADLKAHAINRIDMTTIEQACDATLPLEGADRELLLDTVTRRVVEMV